jgi:hypothetical protein
MSPHEIEEWVRWSVPIAVVYTLGATILSGLQYVVSQCFFTASGAAGTASSSLRSSSWGDRAWGWVDVLRRVVLTVGRFLHAVGVTCSAVALLCIMAVPLVQLDMALLQPMIPMVCGGLWCEKCCCLLLVDVAC